MILFDQAYKRQTISRCKIRIQVERNTLFKLKLLMDSKYPIQTIPPY